MIYETTSTSPEETTSLGEKLGRLLHGGETLEFVSDLGGGKTTFIKGVARGLGFEGEVTSPTFTISRIYHLPSGLELHHFDFYRLAEGDIVAQELAEVQGDPGVIVAIEWPGNAGNVLPSDRLKVQIKANDGNTRQYKILALGPKHQELVEELSK